MKELITSFRGSLRTTIFSKYTELLQLKNSFRIFWNYFWNILKTNAFSKQNHTLYKVAVIFFKMKDMDNNKPMISLIIAGGSLLLLSQGHIKERRKRRQWVCP